MKHWCPSYLYIYIARLIHETDEEAKPALSQQPFDIPVMLIEPRSWGVEIGCITCRLLKKNSVPFLPVSDAYPLACFIAFKRNTFRLPFGFEVTEYVRLRVFAPGEICVNLPAFRYYPDQVWHHFHQTNRGDYLTFYGWLYLNHKVSLDPASE